MVRSMAITAFFKPIAKPSSPSQQTLAPSQLPPSQSQSRSRSPTQPQPTSQLSHSAPEAVSSPTPPSPPSLPSLPVLPVPPTPPPRRFDFPSPGSSPPDFNSSPPLPVSSVRDRSTIIQGSDEEDDDDSSSEDEFPDLFKPTSSVIPMPPPRNNILATPRGKRAALPFHSSPLTFLPKHKFDLAALTKHARADSAIEASKQQIKELEALSAESATNSATDGGDGKQTASLHERMLDVLPDAEDSQEEGNRNRLLQAVKRAETKEHRKRWRFFDPKEAEDLDSGPTIKARYMFPRLPARGAWGFLSDDKHRFEHFEDGLVYAIQMRMQNLPDEIVAWVLRELPSEESRKLREEYLRLLRICSSQVRRLVDEDIVECLFRNIGAPERVFKSTASPAGVEHCDSPSQRDYTPLQTVLRVLLEVSHGLSTPSVTRGVVILLRLGMDAVVHEDPALARDYQDALDYLVGVVPEKSWDKFCGQVCASLYDYAEEPTLQCDAAISIPLLSTRLADLRRRLALVCIFRDTQRGFAAPEKTLTFGAIMDLLEGKEFVVDRKQADFYDLAARAKLLGFAVGDACPPPFAPDQDNVAEARRFNAEIDRLANKVKVIWSNIQGQGGGSTSRLEARLTLQDLERKLQQATRTTPPPKASIFSIEPSEEDLDRPRQQRFMQKFLQNKGKAAAAR